MFEIESVEFENFRTYRGQHQVQLPTRPGVYLLTGRNEAEPRLGSNGVGKSTLLDAIYWCLYGSTTRGLKAGDVISWGESSCSVEVRLQVANDKICIRRAQSPNSLTIGDRQVSQGELQKLLRIGPDAFLHSVMLPQFGDSFFDLKPAEKLTLFTQVMDLDFWLEKSQEAATLADEIEADLQAQKQEASKLGGQKEVLATDIEQLKIKEQNYTATQKGIVAELKREKQSVLRDQKQTAEAVAFAQNALANIAKKLAKIKKGTQVCPACYQVMPRKDQQKDEQALLKNQADFERRLAHLEAEIKVLKSRIKYTIEQIETEEQRENLYRGEISAKYSLLTQLTEKQRKLKAEIERFSADHAAVSYWVTGFKKVRLFVVEEVLRQLEIEVNNNMSSLGLTDWRVEFDVERENKSGGVTKGFTVLVYAPGRAEPVRFEAWSGGETQRLRLAGDLGLANLIMSRAGLVNGMEFYDEPSSHLSAEGVSDLLETLKQRAMLTRRRIWVVEHHSLDYGEFTGVLEAVKTAEGSRLDWE